MHTDSQRWLLGGLAALLAVVAAAPVALAETAPLGPPVPLRLTLPAPTGPYPVGTTELHLVDPDRPDPWLPERVRELMITIWYPARPAGGGPVAPYLPPLAAQRLGDRTDALLGLAGGEVDWTGIRTHARTFAAPVGGPRSMPVLLYSPGGEEVRATGTLLAQDLASRGYAVITMDHTYEALEVEFPGGRLETQALPDLDPADVRHRMIEARVADARFVLDQLGILARGGNPDAGRRPLPPGLGTRLDPSRVGMLGHSGGGFTSAEAMRVDSRVDAGANLDGSMAYHFGDQDYGDVVHSGLDRPFLLMGAGLSDGAPHTHRDAVDWRMFWENSSGWRLDLYAAEGEHFSFADYQAFLPQLDAAFALPDEVVRAAIGTVDPDRIVGSVRAYLTAFFDEHLRDRPQPLLRRESPRHPDITFVR